MSVRIDLENTIVVSYCHSASQIPGPCPVYGDFAHRLECIVDETGFNGSVLAPVKAWNGIQLEVSSPNDGDVSICSCGSEYLFLLSCEVVV